MYQGYIRLITKTINLSKDRSFSETTCKIRSTCLLQLQIMSIHKYYPSQNMYDLSYCNFPENISSFSLLGLTTCYSFGPLSLV